MKARWRIDVDSLVFARGLQSWAELFKCWNGANHEIHESHENKPRALFVSLVSFVVYQFHLVVKRIGNLCCAVRNVMLAGSPRYGGARKNRCR